VVVVMEALVMVKKKRIVVLVSVGHMFLACASAIPCLGWS